MEAGMTNQLTLWRGTVLLGLALALGACSRMTGPNQVGAPGPDAIWFHIMFATDSASVGQDGQQVITDIIATLQRNPGSVVTIIGRTDTVGSQDYNRHLSHLRADAVRDALVYTAAIPADRVETRWTGESRLKVATADEVASAANRVVDIAIH